MPAAPIRAARRTARSVYRPPEATAWPVCIPIRTLIRTPSGHVVRKERELTLDCGEECVACARRRR